MLSTHRSDDCQFEVTIHQSYSKVKKDKPILSIKWKTDGIKVFLIIYESVFYEVVANIVELSFGDYFVEDVKKLVIALFVY